MTRKQNPAEAADFARAGGSMTRHGIFAYYNENDPHAAAWLRELIADGLIAPGEVDERSIEDVRPSDLAGFRQCHWFAGIGGWSYALRLAGWPDDRPVWTGSCPCQPFSQAGARAGADDPRHLWPHFRWIIDQCRPVRVFGEQVASKSGRQWFAGVRADLDLLGYATGAADITAAGVGAPHIRQRLYWVADRSAGRGGLVNPKHSGLEGLARYESDWNEPGRFGAPSNRPTAAAGGGLADGHEPGRLEQRSGGLLDSLGASFGHDSDRRGPWHEVEWVECAGKLRRIKPGVEPLAARLPRGVVPGGDPGASEAQNTSEARVMRLRGYGNSIVPQLAAEFIRACTT